MDILSRIIKPIVNAPHFKKCPTCGSPKIKLVRGNYRTMAREKPITVSNVQRHECPACGEILLDYDAMKKIELRRRVAV